MVFRFLSPSRPNGISLQWYTRRVWQNFRLFTVCLLREMRGKFHPYHKVQITPKLGKSPDRNYNLISSEGGQDTSACQIADHSSHVFPVNTLKYLADRKTVRVGRMEHPNHEREERRYFGLRTDRRTTRKHNASDVWKQRHDKRVQITRQPSTETIILTRHIVNWNMLNKHQRKSKFSFSVCLLLFAFTADTTMHYSHIGPFYNGT